MGEHVLAIVFALFLVLLNGFFVAAEFGMVKLRSTRVRTIAKSLGWRGRVLAKVHGNLDAYLSACQLGITLASLGLGWIGEPAFAALIEPALVSVGIQSEKLISGIAFVTAFFSISYLHIVVGELVPKTLAIRMAERIGLWTAPGLFAFYWGMFPAIWLLNQSANLVIRALKLQPKEGNDGQYSLEELKVILRSSRPTADFSASEWKVLAQSIDFRELEVSDLMRPFQEAAVLFKEESFKRTLARIAQHRYSRYPLIASSGQVVGIVHIKDLFIAMSKDPAFNDLCSMIRPAHFVTPETPATALFRRLQQGAPHLTLVAYDDTSPVGFITLDNLLSALVGDIRDEFRPSQSEWTRLDDGSLLGKGTLPINTLERALGIDIASEEADTVAGLILWKLTELPKEGQRIGFDQFDVVVKKMAGPKILLVRVYPSTQHADLASHH
ncbi:hemolysin family protein [Methylophilus aquaticus]|uniref:Hemolysin family protein n=1 Tax=Methylophilus aquaticus TaxID=1971610 RepID=A0ABT9JQF1_9PROT|nr:hemolysin family protein [Methylophilus aquaticus]MDP8566794.1 hemolysin family protein [Methylophilus aquaticus]